MCVCFTCIVIYLRRYQVFASALVSNRVEFLFVSESSCLECLRGFTVGLGAPYLKERHRRRVVPSDAGL